MTAPEAPSKVDAAAGAGTKRFEVSQQCIQYTMGILNLHPAPTSPAERG